MFRFIKAGSDIQSQRESLIKDLNIKIETIHLDAILIFDAQYQMGEGSRSHIKDLEIFFTTYGQTADEFILQKIKNDPTPAQITVVTSDKKLAWLSRLRGAKTEPVDDFLKWLNSRYRNKIRKDKLTPIPEKILETPPKRVFEPTTTSSVEECHDFYLKRFEASYLEILSKEPVKKANEEPLSKKKIQKKLKKVDPSKSNEERWLEAFERDVSSDEIEK